MMQWSISVGVSSQSERLYNNIYDGDNIVNDGSMGIINELT